MLASKCFAWNKKVLCTNALRVGKVWWHVSIWICWCSLPFFSNRRRGRGFGNRMPNWLIDLLDLNADDLLQRLRPVRWPIKLCNCRWFCNTNFDLLVCEKGIPSAAQHLVVLCFALFRTGKHWLLVGLLIGLNVSLSFVLLSFSILVLCSVLGSLLTDQVCSFPYWCFALFA